MISSGLWDRFRGSREENCDTGLSERSVRKRGKSPNQSLAKESDDVRTSPIPVQGCPWGPRLWESSQLGRWGVGGSGKLGAGSSGKNVELQGGTGRGGGRASSGEEWGSMVTSENQQPLGLALTC